MENYVYTSGWQIYKKPQQTIKLIVLLWQTRKVLFYWMPNYGMLKEEIFIFCRMHACFPIKFVNGLLFPLSAHGVLCPYSVLSNKPLILLSLIYVDNPFFYFIFYVLFSRLLQSMNAGERTFSMSWRLSLLMWYGYINHHHHRHHTYIHILIYNLKSL